MKRALYLFLSTCICISVNSQNTGETPYLVKSLAGQSIRNVEVSTSGGSISVSGSDAGEAKVEVFVNPNNGKDGITLSNDEIRQRLQSDYDLDISIHDNT